MMFSYRSAPLDWDRIGKHNDSAKEKVEKKFRKKVCYVDTMSNMRIIYRCKKILN